MWPGIWELLVIGIIFTITIVIPAAIIGLFAYLIYYLLRRSK